MHISKEQRHHLKFSVQVILAVWPRRFKPEGPWLHSLFSLCFCHSEPFCDPLAFCNSPAARSPPTPAMCCQTFVSTAFPPTPLFSVCLLQNEERTNSTVNPEDIALTVQNPLQTSPGVMYSSFHLPAFSCVAASHQLCFHWGLQQPTQAERMRDAR